MERIASKTTFVEELEKGLAIEEDALNEALMAQPDCFYRVSKQLVVQTSRRDAAKQASAEIEAKIELQIRETAKKRDDKMTNDEVKARLNMSKDVTDAIKTVLDLNYKVGILQALKEAFTQRSYVLKDMVALYAANYYGDATYSSANSGMKDMQADKNRRAMNAATQGKTKWSGS